jgi:hypothetical protein
MTEIETTDNDYQWPSREEWEADQRAHVEHMITHGVGYDYQNGSSFTAAEHDEIQRLEPEVIRTVRRECGRIERRLRHEHPEVVWLLNPGADRYLSGEYDAALKALSPEARDALLDLSRLRDVRRGLVEYGVYCDNEFLLDWVRSWPSRFTQPSSPEIDRLLAIHQQEYARRRACIRGGGRQLLADIESGAAWEREQDHRVRIEKWFRDGPVIHRETAEEIAAKRPHGR